MKKTITIILIMILILSFSVFAISGIEDKPNSFYSYQDSTEIRGLQGYDAEMTGTWNLDTNPISYTLPHGSGGYIPIFQQNASNNNRIKYLILTQENIIRAYLYNETTQSFGVTSSVSFPTEKLFPHAQIVLNDSDVAEIIVASNTQWRKYHIDSDNNINSVCNISHLFGGILNFGAGVTCNEKICASVGTEQGSNDLIITSFNVSDCKSYSSKYPHTPDYRIIAGTFPVLINIDFATSNNLELVFIGAQQGDDSPDIMIATDIYNGSGIVTTTKFFTKFSSNGIKENIGDTRLVTSPIIDSYDGAGDLEIYIAIQNLRTFPLADENYKFRVYDSTGSEVDSFEMLRCDSVLSENVRMFQPSILTYTLDTDAICGACSINGTGDIEIECFEKRTGITLSTVTLLTNITGGMIGYENYRKPNMFTANYRQVDTGDTDGNELFVYGHILDKDLNIIQSGLGETFDYQLSIADLGINYDNDIYLILNTNGSTIIYSTNNINFAPTKTFFSYNPANPVCINESVEFIFRWTDVNSDLTQYRYRCRDTDSFTIYSTESLEYEADIWCNYNSSDVGIQNFKIQVQDEFNASVNHTYSVLIVDDVYPVCNVWCSDCAESETFEVEEEEEIPVTAIPDAHTSAKGFIEEQYGFRSAGSKFILFIVGLVGLLFGIASQQKHLKEYTGVAMIFVGMAWYFYATFYLELIPKWIVFLLIPIVAYIGTNIYRETFMKQSNGD